MKCQQTLLFVLFFLISISVTHAHTWYHHPLSKEVKINVDLFLSSTCVHCRNADAFFRKLEKKESWVVVNRYYINKDKAALHAFYEFLRQHHSDNFAVPAIFFCDSRWAGFLSSDSTGKVLLRALEYCRQKIMTQGELRPATIHVLQQWGNASQFGMGISPKQSAMSLIIISGLTDALSPCSLFCFAAFLAWIWLYPRRKWLQFSLSLVFILSLGIWHYVQQVYSTLYYQNMAEARVPVALVGVLLLFSLVRNVRKSVARAPLAIGWLEFSAVILMVPAIQAYQQTCPFNSSLIIEQWLQGQSFTWGQDVTYHLVYQIMYLLPPVLILLFYFVWGRHKRMHASQRALHLTAYVILFSIAFMLIIFPGLLASLTLSILVWIIALAVGWFFTSRLLNPY